MVKFLFYYLPLIIVLLEILFTFFCVRDFDDNKHCFSYIVYIIFVGISFIPVLNWAVAIAAILFMMMGLAENEIRIKEPKSKIVQKLFIRQE